MGEWLIPDTLWDCEAGFLFCSFFLPLSFVAPNHTPPASGLIDKGRNDLSQKKKEPTSCYQCKKTVGTKMHGI
jgi:hypothetical protein